jgi:TolB protein
MRTKVLSMIFFTLFLVSCTQGAKPTSLESGMSSSQPQTPIAKWITYTSEAFLISLRYPDYWQIDKTGDADYSGIDGFFQITAVHMLTPTAISACNLELQANMGKGGNRYGATPTLEILQVDNQPACLVLPSSDQPKANHNLSLLIVEYPTSLKEHTLLQLWADKDHIRDFIDTLKFTR